MIYIQFGTIKADTAPRQYLWQIDSYYDGYFEDDWNNNDWAKRVVKEIDNTDLIAPKVADSPIFGIIPYQWLSGGSKTLIMMNKIQDIVYDGDYLGDNCWPLFMELGRTKDIAINLSYYPIFKWNDGDKITLIENGKVIDNLEDFISAHINSEYNHKELEFDKINWPIKINAERFKLDITDDDLEFIDESEE